MSAGRADMKTPDRVNSRVADFVLERHFRGQTLVERGLTKRQAEVLRMVVRFMVEQGYPPGIRDVADAFGIKSENGVTCHLEALKKRGVITWERKSARTISLVGYVMVPVPVETAEAMCDGQEEGPAGAVNPRVAGGPPGGP
jgi:hypothetical protein